ncbi:unnamed protein product, partial [Allacma fusca]
EDFPQPPRVCLRIEYLPRKYILPHEATTFNYDNIVSAVLEDKTNQHSYKRISRSVSRSGPLKTQNSRIRWIVCRMSCNGKGYRSTRNGKIFHHQSHLDSPLNFALEKGAVTGMNNQFYTSGLLIPFHVFIRTTSTSREPPIE